MPPGTKRYKKKCCRLGPNGQIHVTPPGSGPQIQNDPGGVTRFYIFCQRQANLPSNQYTSIGKTQIAGIGVNDVINNFNIKVVSTRHESFCKIQI